MATGNLSYKYPPQATTLCAEIINIVTRLPALSPTVDLDAFHASIVAEFDAVIKLCRLNSMPDDAARELIYPLAALVDETLLSNPKYRCYWTERPLQLRYFGEVIAGTKFFAKLEAHISADEPCQEILEAYFASLALGLKGMYGGEEAKRCARVTENLGVMIRDIRIKNGAQAEPAVDKQEKEGARGRTRTIMFLAAAAAILLSATAIFQWSSLRDLTEFLGNF